MEAELIERARHRDMDAFAALVQQHTPGLYRFLRAWQSIPSFRATCSFRSWLYRIAWNLMVTESGRRRREVPWNAETDLPDPTGHRPGERLEQEDERGDQRTAGNAGGNRQG